MLKLTNSGLHILDIIYLKNKLNDNTILNEINNTFTTPLKKMKPSYSSNYKTISPGFIYYLLNYFNLDNEYKFNNIYIKNQINSKYKLKNYQIKISNLIINKQKELNKLKLPLYLTIIAPCGFGKTILAIDYILKQRYNKTFIVIPTFILGENFKTKIETLTNLKCYISKNGSKKFIKECINEEFDILIIPDKHLNNLDFCIYLQNNFSIGIFDECHTNNVQNDVILTHFLNNFTFDSLLFLTATERFENHYSMGISLDVNKYIKRKDYQNFKSYFKITTYDYNILNYEESNSFKLYKKNIHNNKNTRCKQKCFSEDKNRHKIIINSVLNDYNNNNSKILMITLLDNEIFIYMDLLNKYNLNVFPIISGIKYNNIKYKNKYDSLFFNNNYSKIKSNYYNKDNYLNFIKNKDNYIIIGNYDYIGYGVDMIDLNYLHFTNLSTNRIIIQQSVGRISRNNNSDKHFSRFYVGSPTKYINVSNYENKIRQILNDIDCIEE